MDDLTGMFLGLGDRARLEMRAHQLAQFGMRGGVHIDHLLLHIGAVARVHIRHDAGAGLGREDIGVFGNKRDVFVAGQRPVARTLRHSGERAFRLPMHGVIFAQLAEVFVRDAGDKGLRVREINSRHGENDSLSVVVPAIDGHSVWTHWNHRSAR